MPTGGVMSAHASAKRQQLCGVWTSVMDAWGMSAMTFGQGLFNDCAFGFEKQPKQRAHDVERAKDDEHGVPIPETDQQPGDDDGEQPRAEVAHHVHGGVDLSLIHISE